MQSRGLAFCALLLIASLYVVGVVSHGVLRHIVQTGPVWGRPQSGNLILLFCT